MSWFGVILFLAASSTILGSLRTISRPVTGYQEEPDFFLSFRTGWGVSADNDAFVFTVLSQIILYEVRVKPIALL